MNSANSTDGEIPSAPSSSENHDGETARLKFPQHFRIRSSRDFDRIYAGNVRSSNQHLLLFAALNSLPHSRIGLSVSRKNGNSVKRHRIRRLLKEAFRLNQHELPVGLDLILIPGRQGRDASLNDFQAALLENVKRVARKLQNAQSDSLESEKIRD